MATLGRTSPSRLVRTDRDLTLTRTSPPNDLYNRIEDSLCPSYHMHSVWRARCDSSFLPRVGDRACFPPKNTHGGFTYLAVSRHIMAMKTLR
jgi:hypothetical protein